MGASPRRAALAAVVVANVVISTTAQDALFLPSHGRRAIPVAMLAASLLTALATVAVARLGRGRTSGPLLRRLLTGLGLLGALFALWNRLPGPTSTFALFLYVELATTLGAAMTWGWFQAPLTAAELRTVMPRLGLYAGLGGLVGSFAIRGLLVLVAPPALLWLSAGAWIAAAVLVDVAAPTPEVPRRRPGQSPLGQLRRAPLAQALVVGTVALLWLGLAVQFELRAALQRQLPPSEIARTMGLLLGAASLGGILVQAFVTARLLERWGAAVGLAVLPALVGLCAAGFLAAPILGLAAAALLVDKALRPNLHRASESCLVGALPPALRSPLLLALSALVTPLGKALGALALVALAGASSRLVAGVALLLVTLLLLLAGRAGGLYTRTLRTTLEEGAVDRDADGELEEIGAGIDGPRLRQLLLAIDAGSGRRRALAVELLLPHREQLVARAMTVRLDDPKAVVRIAAWRWFLVDPGALPPQGWHQRWRRDDLAPAERVAILEAAGGAIPDLLAADDPALALLDDPAAVEAPGETPAGVRTPRRELRAALLRALGRSGEAPRRRALEALSRLLREGDPTTRIEALELVATVAAEPLLPLVRRAFADGDAQTRRAAATTLARLAPVAEVLPLLDDPRLAAAITRWLALRGPSVSAPVRAAVATASGPRRLALLRLLGAVGSVDDRELLLTEVRTGSGPGPGAALQGLAELQRRRPKLDPPPIEAWLLAAVADGLRLLRAIEALGPSVSPHGLLDRQLGSALADRRGQVVAGLSLRWSSRDLRRAARTLEAPAAPRRDQARELLRALLPPGALRLGATRLLDHAGAWSEGCLAQPLGAVPFVDGGAAARWLAERGDPWLQAALRHDPATAELPLPLVEDPLSHTLDTLLFLKDVLLFEGLTNPQLVEVARLAERLEVPPRHRLFEQGEPPDDLYLVRTGKLRVLVDGRDVAHLGPGEAAGELGLIAGLERSATVEAVEASCLLRFVGADFLALLDGFPEIGRALLRSLARRLAQAGAATAPPLTIDGLIRSRRLPPG